MPLEEHTESSIKFACRTVPDKRRRLYSFRKFNLILGRVGVDIFTVSDRNYVDTGD